MKLIHQSACSSRLFLLPTLDCLGYRADRDDAERNAENHGETQGNLRNPEAAELFRQSPSQPRRAQRKPRAEPGKRNQQRREQEREAKRVIREDAIKRQVWIYGQQVARELRIVAQQGDEKSSSHLHVVVQEPGDEEADDYQCRTAEGGKRRAEMRKRSIRRGKGLTLRTRAPQLHWASPIGREPPQHGQVMTLFASLPINRFEMLLPLQRMPAEQFPRPGHDPGEIDVSPEARRRVCATGLRMIDLPGQPPRMIEAMTKGPVGSVSPLAR
jgi:hypothetical protein